MPVLQSGFERLLRAVFGWSDLPGGKDHERNSRRRLNLCLLCVILASLPVLPIALLMLPLGEIIAAGLMATAAGAALILGFVLQTGRTVAGGMAALLWCGGAVAVLAALTGGAFSPFLFWALALPLAAMDVRPARSTATASVLAMSATIIAAASLHLLAPRTGPYGPGNGYVLVFALAVLAFYVALRALGLGSAGAVATKADAGDEQHAEPRKIVNRRLPGLAGVHDAAGHFLDTRGADLDGVEKAVGVLKGSRFIDHIHVSDRIAFLQAVDRLRVADGTASVAVRLRKADASHELMRVMIELSARRDATGVMTGFESHTRLEQAPFEAEGLEDARIRIMASLADELKTPLNAVLGDVRRDASDADYARRVAQSGERLQTVLDDMQDAVRLHRGDYAAECGLVDMREVVGACEAMVQAAAQDKQIVLTARVARGHKGLTASKRAMEQIVMNLLSNALKYTPPGGAVTLDVESREDRTVFRVSDTGDGIPDTDLPMVGNPFFQVRRQNHPRNEGIGLGLYLVKGLALAHDGRFSVESDAAQGTTVTIDLPNAGPLTARDGVRHGGWPDLPPDSAGKEEKSGEMRYGHAKSA
ncbi:HAMP domain-containing histidine kinase [Hoeflea sp. WL0058]|uniref:histidine kinase n=1 Tax=Flavimaribacter sediminis TaxID=2865987 RepID=A0AAE2ZMM7_9HYPH|nr:HAMP domain-containing sensor histidine kinase [Flavimaribacter sediminis]MBW8639438.1 HAMP domain-containing histidine kinase [Flavimaribacter sediminis]